MSTKRKIFIADDHTLFREGLIKILENEPVNEIIGSAGNGIDALNKILNLKPDIAVLDIEMPGKSGLEILNETKEMKLPTVFVILTMYTDEEYLEKAMSCGAKGYLLKDSTVDEINFCLNAILGGKYFISNKLTDYLIKNSKNKLHSNEINIQLNKLTHSEKQILKLLSEKKTSTQIAEELFVSYRTVQKHRQNISAKFGFQGYNKLLLYAIENKKHIELL